MARPAQDFELVQIVDAALADAAHRAGAWLACRLGCTPCCHGAFVINALDAVRLAEGMRTLRHADPDLAAEIVRRAHAWIAAFAADFPGDPETGILGQSEAEQARFEDFANDAPCPALDPITGRCDIYAWRPMTCRVFGPPVRMEAASDSTALGHCELCFHGATQAEVAACEMPVPHEFEEQLLAQLTDPQETVVAFALLRDGSSRQT
jgi:Fe-S-cluster containining protein